MVENKTDKHTSMSEDELQDLVASNDTGGRDPHSPVLKYLIAGLALVWSVFQIWIAYGGDPFNPTQERAIHLGFAIFLGFMVYPAAKSSPTHYVPLLDWVFAVVGSACALYIFINYGEIALRQGAPTQTDTIIAALGIITLLIVTWRALGPALAILGMIFLVYCHEFIAPNLPDILAWKGSNFEGIADQMWLSTSGVFGIALSVSTDFVFLFVLFGALLDKAGAGNYFIRMAFAGLGHYRGGPAKAAVIASGATGLISGSSIANVVTTGTFTVPMMKRVGFSAEKAGAVEVASSVNGQIMPPVMGAAAFLIAAALQMEYFDVVKHAFLPAVISYIALIYIVHLEAMKANLKGLESSAEKKTLLQTIIGIVIKIAVIVGISVLLYMLVQNILKPYTGENIGYVVAILLLAAYLVLAKYCSGQPDLEVDDPNEEVVKLPKLGETFKAGLHFLLPVILLIWLLMVERLSATKSAFWATAFMIVILLTQKPLFAIYRGQSNKIKERFNEGFNDLIQGLISGARNMIGIGIATAAAGIIVGTVSLTGVGVALSELVEIFSLGNLLIMLILIAFLSLILGMGLPTTANYIVVSSLLAGVVVELGQQNGLFVPLIAVHLFVFYFGIMADVTPPVGLASFAAAAVSGGDPIKTGFIAFFYSLRTAILPFLFIFNTDLLLYEVTFLQGIIVFIVATVAILIFTAACQGWFLTKNRVWETVAMILIALAMFRPGLFMDFIDNPYDTLAPDNFTQAMADIEPGKDMMFKGMKPKDGEMKPYTALLSVPEGNTAEEKFANLGVDLIKNDNGVTVVDDVSAGSIGEKGGLDWDYTVETVLLKRDSLPKELIYIPALLLLLLIVFLQKARRNKQEAFI